MNKVIRWGIMGLGKIAHKFAEGLAFVPDSKLIAVASRDYEKATAFGEKYGVKYCYDSYEAMLSNPEVDVVYIATPHVLHYQNTMMCLEKKKAVLCEKPFAMNLKQVQEMISLAKRKKVFLMEALWTKFLPSFQRVQSMIEAEDIGKIQTIQADFGFKAPYDPQGRIFNPALGGGSLLDVGIYPIFLAVSLLGKPAEIQAKANIGRTGIDYSCGMLFKYNSGALAVLSSSIVAHQSIEANIFGDKARIKMHSPFHTTQTQVERIERFVKDEIIEIESEGNGYNYEAIEVGVCLREGQIESPIMSHADSLELMEVLDWVRAEAGIFYENNA